MSEVRGLLERAEARFPAPDRVMERLTRRRDRKRAARRIASAIVALLIAAAALGGLLNAFRGAGEHRPASNRTTITPESVADLRTAWIGVTPHTPGSDHGLALPPIVDSNTVYVDSSGFFVYAFSTSCASGGRSCVPDWISAGTSKRAGTLPATSGIGGRVVWPVAAANGVLYESAVDQGVLAYPESCGTEAASCRPLWVGAFKGVPSSPVVANEVVYVFAGGHLYAFPTACGTDGKTCTPLWSASTPAAGSHQTSHVVAAGGFVYVTVGRSVYAFSATCSSARCAPVWQAKLPHDRGIDPSVPVVEDGLVFVATSSSTDARLIAYPVSCRGACSARWTWTRTGGRISSDPVAAEGMVFVTEGPSDDTSLVLAFQASCKPEAGRCAPEWTGPGVGRPVVSGDGVFVNLGTNVGAVATYGLHCSTGASTCEPLHAYTGGGAEPIVAGGVVYAAPAGGNALRAFDASCPDPTCPAIWTGTVDGAIRSGPIVTSDAVYVGTSNGDLISFRLSVDRANGNGIGALSGVVILLMVAAIVVLGRRLWSFGRLR
jgi:hypothetical protein